MYTFNAPPKAFVLFYAHVYLKLSLQPVVPEPRRRSLKYNNKDISYQEPMTGYIHLSKNK